MQSLLDWKDSQKLESSAGSLASASKRLQSKSSPKLAKATEQQSAHPQKGSPNASVGPLPDNC